MLVRRTDNDYSQALRRSFQFGFLLLNVYLGSVFYLWVRYYETGMQNRAVTRPAGVEGWLPIAGLMNLKYFLVTGHVPAVHPAAMFLLITFLAMAFLFRKAFCGWLCPIGTLSEYLWLAGRKIFGRNFQLPRWLDIPLRGLKYLLLGFFVWAVSSMSANAIAAFMRSPYGIIADVKMLNFFRHIGQTGLIVLGILVIVSVFVQNFWCRCLCPYGALLGLASFVSPLRIRRHEAACIDCEKCAKACPAWLPVDRLVSIKSAECTGCLECVAVCPAKGALQMAVPSLSQPLYLRQNVISTEAFPSASGRECGVERPGVSDTLRSLVSSASAPEGRKSEVPTSGHIPALAMATGIAVLFFGIVGFAKSAGYWNTDLPRSIYLELVPAADQASHPMPGDPALNQ
jgi:polyferredoxin